MMMDPIMQRVTPQPPEKFIFSFKKYTERIALITTLIAPRGVTIKAGENAYAIKLQTSPRATKSNKEYKRSFQPTIFCFSDKSGFHDWMYC
jgi:hypothetical protein